MFNARNRALFAVAIGVTLIAHGTASADLILFSDPSGLAAEAEFTLEDMGNTLRVRLRNTSTGVPMGFSNSDQILTSISWDFAGATAITGGSVRTGPASMSLNFSVTNVGPNADVSGEFGFGNAGTTGLHPNYLSANQAGTTPFGGPNLDGPVALNGPQGGLVANPVLVPLGGLGAIQDEVVALLALSAPLDDLAFLANGATIEFGSDAAFVHGVPTPAPGGLALLAIGLRRHRRRR